VSSPALYNTVTARYSTDPFSFGKRKKGLRRKRGEGASKKGERFTEKDFFAVKRAWKRCMEKPLRGTPKQGGFFENNFGKLSSVDQIRGDFTSEETYILA